MGVPIAGSDNLTSNLSSLVWMDQVSIVKEWMHLDRSSKGWTDTWGRNIMIQGICPTLKSVQLG